MLCSPGIVGHRYNHYVLEQSRTLVLYQGRMFCHVVNNALWVVRHSVDIQGCIISVREVVFLSLSALFL